MKRSRTPARDRLIEDLRRRTIEWPAYLAKPDEFPATLGDFFRLIVKAKTTADCMRRFRQFLREKGWRKTHFVEERPPVGFDPETWTANEIQRIKDKDKNGGYFENLGWLGMGSAYRSWWKAQKSMKARESARKRKPAS